MIDMKLLEPHYYETIDYGGQTQFHPYYTSEQLQQAVAAERERITDLEAALRQCVDAVGEIPENVEGYMPESLTNVIDKAKELLK